MVWAKSAALSFMAHIPAFSSGGMVAAQMVNMAMPTCVGAYYCGGQSDSRWGG